MLDTLKLQSPPLTPEQTEAIEQHLKLRLGFNMATGEELYSLCSGSLSGSYQSSVAVNVKRKQYKHLPATEFSKATTLLEPCDPYVEFEGSVHKAMLGHNVFGGPECLRKSVAWFIHNLEERLGVKLPSFEEWIILRVDISQVYDLGSHNAVQQFIAGMNNAHYPRRNATRYANSTIMFKGAHTTLKFYDKGPEFKRYGWNHLVKVSDFRYAEEVQGRADKYLRVEVSIRSNKLRQLSSTGVPTVETLTIESLNQLHFDEVSKVCAIASDDLKTVRRESEVIERLQSVYPERLATTLYNFWLCMSGSGEATARKIEKRPTFYRKKKQLKDAGVSWTHTNVKILDHESLIPFDFMPTVESAYRVVGESTKVIEALFSERSA